MARIVAVCISEKKGTQKHDIKEGILKEDVGLVGDAHSCAGWHRQLSLLGMSSINKMLNLGADVGPGAFAENLTIEDGDIVLYKLPIGARLAVGRDGIILEVTQIGKECHEHCAIFQQVGTCVMPVEGIFTRIIKGGKVRAGDECRLIKTE